MVPDRQITTTLIGWEACGSRTSKHHFLVTDPPFNTALMSVFSEQPISPKEDAPIRTVFLLMRWAERGVVWPAICDWLKQVASVESTNSLIAHSKVER